MSAFPFSKWCVTFYQHFAATITLLSLQKSIRVRDSKFGLALVIETMPQSGAYVLGFRVDPSELLYQTAQEIQNIHQVFSVEPVFGVSYAQDDKVECPRVYYHSNSCYVLQPTPLSQLKVKRKPDDVEIVGEEEENDAFAMYFADVNKHRDREPVFNSELGLAIESLPDGITLENLWQCVN
jgi:Bardet-Biedl syndrome 5 protein